MQFDGPQEQLSARRVLAYSEFKKRVVGLTKSDPDFARTHVSESGTFLFSAHSLGMAVRQVSQ